MLCKLCRLFAVVSCFSLIACKDYKVHEVKDFRLYVKSDDTELKAAINELAAQYNKDVGAKALTVVDNKGDANSSISFVENLADKGGSKLGLGQWITTERENNNGASKKITVYHSMALEFDAANFEGKLAGMADKNSDAYKHLYHLFCHEVGHGMELNHSDDRSNVMYKSIPERYTSAINFDAYFAYIRSYLHIAAPAAKTNLI